MVTLIDLWFWAFMVTGNVALVTTGFWLMSLPDWFAFFGGVLIILIQITLNVHILRKYIAYKKKKFNSAIERNNNEKEK